MNETIFVTFPDGKQIQVTKGTSVKKCINEFGVPEEHLFGVKINNEICSTDTQIEYSCNVSPVIDNSKEGCEIYRRSLCLLLACASHKLYPGARLLVGHSLGYGYYYTLESGSKIKTAEIEALKNEMLKIIQAETPITLERISHSQACELFEKLNLADTRKQLNFFCPPSVRINTIDGFSDLYFGPVVPSTKYLKVFDLKEYGEGFLLRFPKSNDHSKLPEFVDEPKLFEVYKKYKDWGKRVGVTSAATLNEIALSKHAITDFINITETFQEKNIADTASKIVESGKVKVVLIAGPSSSGKTTTSKKLALELQAIGYTPKVISLDCYYLGADKTPKDENGNPDFECLEALDVELINQNLIDLFDGKEVIIPTYDFHTSSRFFEDKNKMKLGENEILVMEGIHGLNPKLTAKIPDENKFKIYLSPLTQLNLDDHNRISTRSNRLVRRIVRDARYRGKPAAGTIAMWDSVQKGELLHIFPFQNNADAILNTALDYELAVLKVYAEPLLRAVRPDQIEYAEATELLSFLSKFPSIPATDVPSHSIIREFIGGSAFKY